MQSSTESRTKAFAAKLFLFSLSISLLCAFESAPSMVFVNSSYSGHEEITRQAINNVISKFKADGLTALFKTEDLTTDLDAAPKGLFGSNSRNMLIHGNFATDFPNQTTIMSLASFWNMPGMSYAENPKTQVLHFLRNYKNATTLASAMDTCLQSRLAIKIITEEAVNSWIKGDKTRSLFLLGHATHVIQDSFSPAHARRDSGQNNYNVKNICFYGAQINKAIYSNEVCYHNLIDQGDVIWNVQASQKDLTSNLWPNEPSIQCDKGANYPQTDKQKRGCLKHEARLARLATEKYLYIVFAHLNIPQRKPMADFIVSLDTRLFDGPVGEASLDTKMAAGIMRCENLSNVEIVGSSTMENAGG